ncbi:MAG: FIST C-terminal domain-containing protein [Actinobacteria bacterium]|nr:FIST C-terminal domain-containing protein [Actinomycetota bacterium]
MPFAAALSEHPEAAAATGEVAGEVLESIGQQPDLAVLFASGAHTEQMEDIASTVHSILQPATLLGATAVSIIGGAREVEDQPALSLWAARFATGGDGAPALETVRLDAVNTGDGAAILGLSTDAFEGKAAMVLLAEPSSFPLDQLLGSLRAEGMRLPIIGGVASAGFSPGSNRLVLDDRVYDDGAVGVLLPAGIVDLALVVSQGCRPVGDPLTVTRSEANVVFEVAGRPAFERLSELITAMPEPERRLAQHGLHIGRVIDEHKLDFDRGDFLIRNLVGADEQQGAIAVNDIVEVGSTVQFQVRDADAADDDLRALLGGHDARAALVFTCNGRGIRLFGEADHDASVVTDLTGSRATAGMFCAGEIGPVGGQTFLHGFTASVALFNDR